MVKSYTCGNTVNIRTASGQDINNIKYMKGLTEKMKKFRRSPFTIACYVFAALFAAYFIAVLISTVTTITQYYAAYDMSPTFGEVVTYLFQQGLTPLVAAIVTFMSGIILDEVRKGNPANWASDEEISEAKEAKRLAKEAKQIAKGEAAAAAAAAAETLDTSEEIKPEFSAVVAEQSENTVEFEGGKEAEEAAAEAEETVKEAADAAEEEAEETAEETSDVFEAVVAEDAEEDK